jgi:hypothetical protein
MSLLLLFRQSPYHKALLETAKRLLSQNEPAVALVTALMACEIYTEQIIVAAFQKRGFADLQDPVMALFSTNSLTNDRLRDLYVALTGDDITKASFWARFKASSKLRNGAVHHGDRVSVDEARAACDVAREFVAHMDAVAKSLQ